MKKILVKNCMSCPFSGAIKRKDGHTVLWCYKSDKRIGDKAHYKLHPIPWHCTLPDDDFFSTASTL